MTLFVKSKRCFNKLLVNICLVLISILIPIIFIEVFLQIFLPVPYSMEVEYISDGFVGCRLAPNKSYKLKSSGICSINNLGFRGAGNIQYLKPLGTFRIVVLGGSAVFSYQIDDNSVWSYLLEKKLKHKYNYNIEVINAGVPGYSIFESKINYLYKIRDINPDVAIVYHTWNDMKYFNALESGKNIYKQAYKESKVKIKSLLRHFQIAWRIRSFYHGYILPRKRENVYSDSLSAQTSIISNGGRAHQWERRNFEDLSLILKSDGVLPIFVTQASLLSEKNINNPEIRAEIRCEYQGLTYRQILDQWNIISEIIKNGAEKRDVILVDVHSECPHDLSYLEDHVHLTKRGNEKVAEIIFKTVTNNDKFNSFIKKRMSENKK